MNAFDFDNTLYHGESSVDLALFLINSNKKIILHLPSIFSNLLKYKLCIAGRDELESAINSFLKTVIRDQKELEILIDRFWEKYQCRLDMRMLGLIKKDDVIITAGPTLLVSRIKHRLNTNNIIGTEIDADRKKVTYFNFSDNKAKRYKSIFGKKRINCFFTDSYNDKALMNIADNVFIVKNGKLKKIKGKKKS